MFSVRLKRPLNTSVFSCTIDTRSFMDQSGAHLMSISTIAVSEMIPITVVVAISVAVPVAASYLWCQNFRRNGP